MQKIFLFIALFYLSNTFGQEINSFDENGKRHGVWEKYYDNTKNLRYKGQFNHGKEVGVFKFFHQEPKGKHPSCVKEFSPDSDIALVKYYTSTGVFLSKGKMKGKKRTGTWLSYERATGVLVDKEEYKDGVLNGTKTSYYADGKVLQTQEYKNNLAHGKKIMYAPNGKISSQYVFSNGKQFIETAETMIKNDILIKDEFFVSEIYNILLKSGKKFVIDIAEEFVPFGTPEDIKRFEMK